MWRYSRCGPSAGVKIISWWNIFKMSTTSLLSLFTVRRSRRSACSVRSKAGRRVVLCGFIVGVAVAISGSNIMACWGRLQPLCPSSHVERSAKIAVDVISHLFKAFCSTVGVYGVRLQLRGSLAWMKMERIDGMRAGTRRGRGEH